MFVMSPDMFIHIIQRINIGAMFGSEIVFKISNPRKSYSIVYLMSLYLLKKKGLNSSKPFYQDTFQYLYQESGHSHSQSLASLARPLKTNKL